MSKPLSRDVIEALLIVFCAAVIAAGIAAMITLLATAAKAQEVDDDCVAVGDTSIGTQYECAGDVRGEAPPLVSTTDTSNHRTVKNPVMTNCLAWEVTVKDPGMTNCLAWEVLVGGEVCAVVTPGKIERVECAAWGDEASDSVPAWVGLALLASAFGILFLVPRRDDRRRPGAATAWR